LCRYASTCQCAQAKHLSKLLAERLVVIDPGFGIEVAYLTASWVEALTEHP
jgi:protein ImuB